jgi:ribosomal protein S18 acetylase RimI-like enzyme
MRVPRLSIYLYCVASANCFIIQLQTTRVSRTSPKEASTDLQVDVPRTTRTTTTTFRRIEERDVPDIVRMYVREYGPSNPQQLFTLFPRKLFEKNQHMRILSDGADFCDNFCLACIIYLALYQRIKRRWVTEPDHQVWGLFREDGEIVGAAELSLERPGQRASPLCTPVNVKKLFAGNNMSLQPYVSNVIVKESFRGCGYGQTLLTKLESEALRLGFSHLTLHVDVNAQAALSLYSKLGFASRDTHKGNDILGRFVLFLAGLYFIEDSELLYMKKELN